MITTRLPEGCVRLLARALLMLVGCFAVSACGPAGDNSTLSGSEKTAKVPASGEVIYNRWCISCHLSGVSGSPRLGRHEDWSMRLPKGRDTMLMNLKAGIGAMPPRGLCSSCSDEELEASLDYMLDALK